MRDLWRPGIRRRHRDSRGQTLVEFALVLPMLLVLLLGIADFGRVFQAGITVEAAARNAAEAAAQEYLKNPPAPFPSAAPMPGDAAYYEDLHDLAASTACHEMRFLQNSGYEDGSGSCGGVVVFACVHDTADPSCGVTPNGAAAPADVAQCSGVTPSAPVQNAETPDRRFVEVRVCYLFTTLFSISDLDLPFGWNLTLGEVVLDRERTFTVADW